MLKVEPILSIMVKVGTPLLLATLGEIYAERSGVLNLGIEGIMAFGASIGFAFAYSTGNPWVGLLAAAALGTFLALAHAYACVDLRANQVVSGLALTMLGLGLSSLAGRRYVGLPLENRLSPFKVPLLSDIPVVGPSLFSQDLMVYASYALAFLMWLLLYYTKVGIDIRAVGENPGAADSLGINVGLIRYACVVVSGALSGLAGAYVSVVYMGTWIEGITLGKGWMAVALTIFSFWNPALAPVGAYLFSFIEVLSLWMQKGGVNPYLSGMLPYAITILALVAAASETLKRRMGAPRALGKPYHREERTI